jgi:hypothetical protein
MSTPKEAVMGLSPHELRKLQDLDRRLERDDPLLADLYSTAFAETGRTDRPPAEPGPPDPPPATLGTGAIMVIALLFLTVLAFVAYTVTRAPGGTEPAPSRSAAMLIDGPAPDNTAQATSAERASR